MRTALDYDINGARPAAARDTASTPSTQRRFRHVTPAPTTRPVIEADEAQRREPGVVVDLGLRRSARGLPLDAAPLLVNLARCVIEILAGVRTLDQVARWVTDDVYLHLLRRATISARSRAITGAEVRRPRLVIGTPRITEPSEGVVEGVVLAHQPARSRAVAIRLDDVGGRWRASAISVL